MFPKFNKKDKKSQTESSRSLEDDKSPINNPELGSELVRVSTSIKPGRDGQVVKVGGKLYRIKELG